VVIINPTILARSTFHRYFASNNDDFG
ncbi:Glyceraldehyde-3-phosphate dehydrogenase, partial [Caenorhabditis elegans]